MAKRVARSQKTIGKTRKTAPVIPKELSAKPIRSAVAGRRLRVRKRKTILAMARVLAGKLQ